MYLGEIVEEGADRRRLGAPLHPYTEALIGAVPHADGAGVLPEALPGEVPDPARPPQGCRFHPRCPQRSTAARTTIRSSRRSASGGGAAGCTPPEPVTRLAPRQRSSSRTLKRTWSR